MRVSLGVSGKSIRERRKELTKKGRKEQRKEGTKENNNNSSELKDHSCLTLYNPMDYRDQAILQAKILERVVFLFSRGSSQHMDQTQVSCIAGGLFTS